MYDLPIFPLNTVLFPGMPLRLHIFEERYKLMLQHVLRGNRTFGVCLIKSGAEALGPVALPYHTGCTARIVEVDVLEDGRANLTAVGDERFRILKSGPAMPFPRAVVENAPLLSAHSIPLARGAHVLRGQLGEYLALLNRLESQENAGDEEIDFYLTGLDLPDDPLALIYLAASLLQVPAGEKQPLLEADTGADLLRLLQRLLRRELAVLPPLLSVSPEQARLSAWVN